MKFSKIFLSFLFVISTYVLYGQTEVKGYALISITQSPIPDINCIKITYEDGKQTKVDLPKFDLSQKAISSYQSSIDIEITKTLNEMANKGYKVISVHSSLTQQAVYTLEKVN